MDLGIDKAKWQAGKARIAGLVGDPGKMRLAVIVLVTGLTLGGLYYPLSGEIGLQRAAVASEKDRLDTIRDVESLRREVKAFRSRIDKQSDTNEWVQYLLDGSRQCGVRLRGMETKEPRAVGPYTAVVLVMEVQGTYPQLQAFVEWLEQSERLLRVDALRMEKLPGTVVMKINLLGLVHKNA
jgi:hypothetical protein